jgi:hypothetical protein
LQFACYEPSSQGGSRNRIPGRFELRQSEMEIAMSGSSDDEADLPTPSQRRDPDSPIDAGADGVGGDQGAPQKDDAVQRFDRHPDPGCVPAGYEQGPLLQRQLCSIPLDVEGVQDSHPKTSRATY